MELTNIKFTLSKIHKLNRDPKILNKVFLLALFVLTVCLMPGKW